MSIPTTQKAWVAVRKGSPAQVLQLKTDVPVEQKLAKGEVLVKIQAGALNPVGYKIMKHIPGILVKRPYIPENDLAGVVISSNDTKFKEGDEVFGFISANAGLKTGRGVLSEYQPVAASDLALRPANVTPTQAAGLTLAALTAFQALFALGGLEEGQTVFINGGSTAVGSFAIQYAKAKGCKVVTSASGKNEEYVRSLGADEFIDYTKAPLHETLIALAPSPKYHLFLEAAALIDPALYTHSEAYLVPGGKFLSVGPMPTSVMSVVRMAWAAFLHPTFLGGTKRPFKMISLTPSEQDLQYLRQLVAEGKIKPLVDSVYAFEDAPKAYDRIMTGRATGKVVVKVDPTVE